MKYDTLLVIDMQNDFVTGSLAVPGAKEIIEPIAETIRHFKSWDRKVVFTKDWHPEDHCSFSEFPPHCIAGSEGADIVDELYPTNPHVLVKGLYKDQEEFSPSIPYLSAAVRGRVLVVGLALDYCVAATARRLSGLVVDTSIRLSQTRAIDTNVQPLLEELLRKGIKIV